MSCVEVDTAGRRAVEPAAVLTLALRHPAWSRLALAIWNGAIVAHGLTTVAPPEYATVFYR